MVGERPVEVEILREALRELAGLRVGEVVEDEDVPEAGPDEEIDYEGVGESFLGGAGRGKTKGGGG